MTLEAVRIFIFAMMLTWIVIAVLLLFASFVVLKNNFVVSDLALRVLDGFFVAWPWLLGAAAFVDVLSGDWLGAAVNGAFLALWLLGGDDGRKRRRRLKKLGERVIEDVRGRLRVVVTAGGVSS